MSLGVPLGPAVTVTTGVIGYERTACISDDGLYRYWLRHMWDASKPIGLVCGCNPSTATADTDDPTIRSMRERATLWGWGGFTIVNVAALRSSKPDAVLVAVREGRDAVGPEQDQRFGEAVRWLREHNASLVDLCAAYSVPVVAIWGDCIVWAKAPPPLRGRDGYMLALLRLVGEVSCLGTTASGAPTHPMARGRSRIPIDAPLRPYPGGAR
jgi:hypothetical protein